MESDKMLSSTVYQAILSDIYNGKYVYQSQLPSLLTLCDMYQVGRNTMRTAILQLQEQNVVRIEKGSKARVIFDIHDFEANHVFLQTIINRRQMSNDIFYALEWVMPDIVIKSMRCADKAQMQQLDAKVKKLLNDDSITSVEQIMAHLMNIYLCCLSFLGNPLLCDMFERMMRSVVLPTTDSLSSSGKIKDQMKYIKPILSNALSFALKGNDFMVRKLIAAFTSMYRMQIIRYINKICDGMEPTQNARMMWISRREQEYLYGQVVIGIMQDIGAGVYKENALLPSMAELAKAYDVSMRTSRKAIEVLNELGIVQTLNGLGSKIIWYKGQGKTITCSRRVADNLYHYVHAQNLIELLAQGLVSKSFMKASDEDVASLIKHLREEENFYSSIYQFIFHHSNTCLLDIYKELQKPMIWSVYVTFTLDMSEINKEIAIAREELITLLEQRKYRKAAKVITEVTDKAGAHANSFINNKLIVIEDDEADFALQAMV